MGPKCALGQATGWAKERRSDCAIVVDEVHNAASNKTLCTFIDSFGRALLLTAAVPEARAEALEFSRPYVLQVPEAIETDNAQCRRAMHATHVEHAWRSVSDQERRKSPWFIEKASCADQLAS